MPRSRYSFKQVMTAIFVAVKVCTSAHTSNRTSHPGQYFPQYDSQRVKISYGPFTAPPMTVNDGMSDFGLQGIEMPCSDCLVTYMHAGLEYLNGTVANAKTDLWLHHTVFANVNRTDPVCGYYDQFFASGNERTPVDLTVNSTTQAGYYIGPTDAFVMIAELMNMSPDPQEAVVTVTFEYIQKVPTSFSKVTVIWLDIGGCTGGSDQPVKSLTQAFEYTSPQYLSTVHGRVVVTAGHIHDGGIQVLVERNTTAICDSVAVYGADPAYIGGGMVMNTTTSSMDMSSMTMSMATSTSSMDMSPTTMSMAMPSGTSSATLKDNVHISNMSACYNPSNGMIVLGDNLTVTANYDPTKHDLMMYMNGTAAPIMGISLLYVADNNVTIAAVNSSSSATASSTSSAASSQATSGAERTISPLVLCAVLGLASLFAAGMLP